MPGLANGCQLEGVAAGPGGDEPFAAGMEGDPGISWKRILGRGTQENGWKWGT